MLYQVIEQVVELSRLTIVGIALVSILSASGIGETRVMLKAEEISSETKKCDDDNSEILCPHFQDDRVSAATS